MQRPRRRPTSAAQSQQRPRWELILWLTLVCGCAVERAFGQPTSPTAPASPNVTAPTLAPAPQANNDTSYTEAPSVMEAPPTAAPTAAPVTMPTMAPTTGAPPTMEPTVAPTTMPTTLAPTAAPAESPVTVPPTKAPIVTATDAPVAAPTPAPVVAETDRPTAEPQQQTTQAPMAAPVERKRATVQGITAAFGQAETIPDDQYETFQQIVSQWFNNYYNADNRKRNRQMQFRFRRQLQNNNNDIRRSVQDMDSTIDITNQAADGATNFVTYSQTLEYDATSDAPDADALVLDPWKDDAYTVELANALSKELPQSFANVASPLSTPIIDTATPTNSPVTNNDDDDSFWSLGVIIGVAVGGAVVLLGAVWFLWHCCGGSGDDSKSPNHAGHDVPYHDAGDSLYNPPSQFGFSLGNEDEISRMEDPTVAKSPDSESIGGNPYGDQSVATVDYDYSKAYGGGGDASIVSSVGGTLGDNTRQTAGDVAAGSAAARMALGASYESSDPSRPYGRSAAAAYQEQVMVIDAPAGKLGVVIDTPDDGAPVVHAVKDSSVIADQIQVGDKLIAVDDEDVRSMTAIKVSKLISKKSANPSRRLTIVRSVPMPR